MTFTARLNQTEREQATAEVYAKLLTHPGMDNASAMMDPYSEEVHVTVQGAQRPRQLSQDLMIRDGAAAIEVVVHVVDAPVGEPEYKGGADYLRSVGGCRGGIVVKDAAGQYGLLTARHCGAPVGTYEEASLTRVEKLAGGVHVYR